MKGGFYKNHRFSQTGGATNMNFTTNKNTVLCLRLSQALQICFTKKSFFIYDGVYNAMNSLTKYQNYS